MSAIGEKIKMPNVILYLVDHKSNIKEWPVETKSMVKNNLYKQPRHGYKSAMEGYQTRRIKSSVTNCTIVELLPERFKRLLSEWKMQAALLPSATAMAMLPSYQEIIGMGKPALPLILNELKDKPSHLFWALKAISGIDPVPPEDRGRINKMVEAWINWGRQKKIIG